MAAVNELSPVVGTQAACEVLGLPRASYYRQQRPTFGPSKKAVSARALSLTERDTVLACLHEERFQDRSPAAVFASLLDEDSPPFVKSFLAVFIRSSFDGDSVPKPLGFSALWQTILVLKPQRSGLWRMGWARGSSSATPRVRTRVSARVASLRCPILCSSISSIAHPT
jgi:hypothetical protein